jgi:hypothetical protein
MFPCILDARANAPTFDYLFCANRNFLLYNECKLD